MLTQNIQYPGDMMKSIWTFAALLAVAAIPILLATNTSKRKVVIPVAGDANDIFEWEFQED